MNWRWRWSGQYRRQNLTDEKGSEEEEDVETPPPKILGDGNLGLRVSARGIGRLPI